MAIVTVIVKTSFSGNIQQEQGFQGEDNNLHNTLPDASNIQSNTFTGKQTNNVFVLDHPFVTSSLRDSERDDARVSGSQERDDAGDSRSQERNDTQFLGSHVTFLERHSQRSCYHAPASANTPGTIPVTISIRAPHHMGHVLRNKATRKNQNRNLLVIPRAPLVPKFKPCKAIEFCLLSTRSIKNKATILNHFVIGEKIDIMAFTETWLLPGDIDQARTFRLILVYRPPPSKKNSSTHELFFDEFESILEQLATEKGHIMVVGDFNFHMDDHNNTYAGKFMELLQTFDYAQYVEQPTHKGNHILDLIITRSEDNIVGHISVIAPALSDHYAIRCKVLLPKLPLEKKEIICRSLNRIALSSFRKDIKNLNLIDNDIVSLNDLVEIYNIKLGSLLDAHAPATEK